MRNDMKPPSQLLPVLRYALAAFFFILAAGVFIGSLKGGHALVIAGGMVIATGCMGMCAVCIAPPMARALASGFTSWLIVPERQFDRPQIIYGPIEKLRTLEQSEEALARLQQIVEDHPEELKAYLLMMEIAATDLKDDDLVEDIYELALPHIRKNDEKARLEDAYSLYSA